MATVIPTAILIMMTLLYVVSADEVTRPREGGVEITTGRGDEGVAALCDRSRPLSCQRLPRGRKKERGGGGGRRDSTFRAEI